jgi:hypothetical protein
MAREYKWKIENIKLAKAEDGLTDVVKKIYWGRYVEETINGQLFTAEKFGEFFLPAADPTNFTEFQNLTYAEVTSWLDAILPVEHIDSRINDVLTIRIAKNQYTPNSLPNDINNTRVE